MNSFVSDATGAAGDVALLVARPDLATLSVSGPDRATWLQGVVTCDVASLAPGDGRWGLVLSRTGKLLSDVLVVATESALLLGVPRTSVEAVERWLAGFLVMEDAELENATASWSWFSFHGPAGQAAAARLSTVVSGFVGKIDTTGLGGAVVVVPAPRVADVEAAARADAVVTVASDADWQRLRVERLVPLFGVDMDERQSPHEVSLDRRAVSWDKGCYLGQEAVCMLEMRGKVKRRLVVLEIEGEAAPTTGTPVVDGEGKAVGETRSAAPSPIGGAPVAMALLGEPGTAPGTRVSVGGVAAVVISPNR